MNSNLGAVFRQLRELKGYSQEYVACQLNISQKAYSKLEREEIKIDWKRICEFAGIIEIDPINIVKFDAHDFFKPSEKNKAQKEVDFSSKIEELYRNHIEHLEEEIRFLRKQLA